MTLSQDLRLRIVNMVKSGASRRQAAAHFEVSVKSAIRFAKQFDTQGHVEAKKGRLRKSRLDPYREDILAWIEQTPDLTLLELCERLAQAHGLKIATSTLDDWLRAQGLSYKKNGTRQRTRTRRCSSGPSRSGLSLSQSCRRRQTARAA